MKSKVALSIAGAAMTIGLVFAGSGVAQAAGLSGTYACPSNKQLRLSYTASGLHGLTFVNPAGTRYSKEYTQSGSQVRYSPWAGTSGYWFTTNTVLGTATITNINASCV